MLAFGRTLIYVVEVEVEVAFTEATVLKTTEAAASVVSNVATALLCRLQWCGLSLNSLLENLSVVFDVWCQNNRQVLRERLGINDIIIVIQ